MSTRTATLKIATPEGVTFAIPIAGPVTRGLAYFFDFLIISAAFSLLRPFLEAMAIFSVDTAVAVIILVQFVFVEGTRMVFELLWRGQTPGKKILGLRVMDERGLKLRPSQVVIRNVLRFVDALPFFYAVGGVFALFSRKSQRLGDLAAGTVVTWKFKSAPPDVESVLAGKYNSFHDHPHLESRLRQKVTPEEAQLALQTLVRRDELDNEARVSLFASLAERLRTKVTFPEEAVHGLSDEQYVRNVVGSMFRKRKA